MRPAGEIRKALLDAVTALAVSGGGSLRELAAAAQVPVDVARRTVDNACRAGEIHRGPDRVVPYRNRPVATYLPKDHAPVAANESISGVAVLLQAWG